MSRSKLPKHDPKQLDFCDQLFPRSVFEPGVQPGRPGLPRFPGHRYYVTERGPGIKLPRSPYRIGGPTGAATASTVRLRSSDAVTSAQPGAEALHALRELISELATEKRDIENLLAKPNAELREAEAAIRRSHGGNPEVVVQADFSRLAKAGRKVNYNQLLRLAAAYGPYRQTRRRIIAQLKSLEREERLLAARMAKRQSKDHATD